jgi:citrate synthase
MKIIKKACFDVLEKLGVRTKLLEIPVELEEITLEDDYFIERKLYPNVDYYSGVIYNAIGTPAPGLHWSEPPVLRPHRRALIRRAP